MKEFSAYSDIFLSRAQVYLSYFLPAPPSVKDDNNNNNNDGGNNQNDILFNLGNRFSISNFLLIRTMSSPIFGCFASSLWRSLRKIVEIWHIPPMYILFWRLVQLSYNFWSFLIQLGVYMSVNFRSLQIFEGFHANSEVIIGAITGPHGIPLFY